MTKRQGYALALGIFGVVVLILAWPYLQAQFKPIQSLPEDQNEGSPDSAEVGTPNTLRIVALGIEAPVISVEEKSEPVYQAALRDGVVHYPGTAEPGEPGNAYIFGHSSDYVWAPGEYKTIFAKLPQIELGTEIEITNAEGQKFIYQVVETKVVGPRDLSVLDQFDGTRSVLTLQTSYPLGTALQRYIVVADLVP